MTTRTQGGGAAALAGSNGFVLISSEKLRQLYATMVKCRMFEERARSLLEQSGFLGGFDPAVGQEAVAVGVALALLPEDTIAPSQHNVIVDFIKGIPLEKIFGALFSYAAQPNLGTQINLAISAALDNKMKMNGGIAVAFCGDSSALRNFWDDALCVAGDQQLPILFVCQNCSMDRPSRHSKHAKIDEVTFQADPRRLPAITVDGNDAVAVYRVATEAIAHARKGNGPTLIECTIVRSKAQDPIRKMERYLKRKGLFDREMEFEVTAGFSRQLEAAIEVTRRVAFPK
jgi:pyruvate dehydrogenase E1 component alpha subunit